MLKKFIEKHIKKIIIFFTALFGLIGIINFYFIFEVTAQSNDECLWIPKKIGVDSIAITFDQVKFEGVAWEAGIRDGDRLLAIDGVKTTNVVVATQVLDKVHKGDYATYTVSRDGRIFEAKVVVKKLINFQGLGFALLSIIWLFVGFVVVIAKPEGTTQRIFYLIGIASVTFASYSFLYRGSVVQNPIFENFVLLFVNDIAWTLGAAFFPFLLIYFFLNFPKERKILKKRWTKKFFYLTPLFIFFASIVFRIIFIYSNNQQIDSVYNIMSVSFFYIVYAGMFIGLIILFMSYLKLETKKERNAIFVILISFTIGIISILFTYTLAGAIAGIIFNNPIYFTPIILIAIIPISFGYSIFRYSLMDISDVVKKGVMYLTATISLAGIYFFVIYLIGQAISSAIGTEYQAVIAGAIFIVFALVFQSTKDKFQELITRKFYPEQFAFQKVLLKFSNDIPTIVGLENILDSTLNTFVQSLSLEHFGVLLKNNVGSRFELHRSEGIFDGSLFIDYNERQLQEFVEDKQHKALQPVIERDEFEKVFGTESSKLIDEQIYTIIPMIIKSKIVGLLFFGLKYSGTQFSGKDLELLVASANQAAIAVENARLYESEAQKMRMERDLENAKRIQESLLPKEFPDIKGLDIDGTMIPAMHVGGDYFDLIKISDKKIFVIIADVSGKGLSASFYMTKVETMMKLYCTAERTPKDVLIEINKRIFGAIERSWFITISVAMFDLEKNILTFCRAGHTPLLKINSGKIEQFQSSGIGVGLEKGELFNSSLEEITLPLTKNDIFLFFSDGVNEAMNNAGEMFGMEKLENIFKENSAGSSHKILNTILDSLDKFRNGSEQHDDITLVVIKAV